MDEDEFERLLELFPVVRPRDYHVDTHTQYSSRSGHSEDWHDAWEQDDKWTKGINLHGNPAELYDNEPIDPSFLLTMFFIRRDFFSWRTFAHGDSLLLWADSFWEKLKLAAEKKVGAADAEKFCRAFQRIHHQVVYNELSMDAAWKFLNSSRC
ncbi:uncharacterized protein [Rutidosis leptorrhynchoides]|uniref:uncharacterized protein n=1 Tax=Rutidosis leptorrhynchoides TaxID=125765 RepID=UPI003A993093